MSPASVRFQKAWEIIGWAYDADLHCPECAEKRFPGIHTADDGTSDYNDAEGNPVHPLFACDELDYEPNCGDCLGGLR